MPLRARGGGADTQGLPGSQGAGSPGAWKRRGLGKLTGAPPAWLETGGAAVPTPPGAGHGGRQALLRERGTKHPRGSLLPPCCGAGLGCSRHCLRPSPVCNVHGRALPREPCRYFSMSPALAPLFPCSGKPGRRRPCWPQCLGGVALMPSPSRTAPLPSGLRAPRFQLQCPILGQQTGLGGHVATARGSMHRTPPPPNCMGSSPSPSPMRPRILRRAPRGLLRLGPGLPGRCRAPGLASRPLLARRAAASSQRWSCALSPSLSVSPPPP